MFDKSLPNSEPKLRAVFDKLTAKFGTVLVVVDQPASIGALPLAVARAAGCEVAYLPGLAMRRIAGLCPGEAETDAKDPRRLVESVRPRALRMAGRLVDDIFTALDDQAVTVPGTGTLGVIVPSPAKSLAAVHEQRRTLKARIETLLEAHPLSHVLTSMPGIGVRTAAVLLTPAARQSGTSIHGGHAPRGGNRQLKRAMFLSSFAALHDPATASASCSPCSATERRTNRGALDSLDEGHSELPEFRRVGLSVAVPCSAATGSACPAGHEGAGSALMPRQGP